MVNSRPLTYACLEAGEPSALTPAHFLIGQQFTTLPDGDSTEDSVNHSGAKEYLRRLQHRQSLLDHFWRRWKHEYILTLPSAHRSPGSSSRNLAVGDIVIVDTPNKAKFMWPLAKVEEVYFGNDGIVRACRLRLSSGKSLKRPAQKVYYLEIGATTTEAPEDVRT